MGLPGHLGGQQQNQMNMQGSQRLRQQGGGQQQQMATLGLDHSMAGCTVTAGQAGTILGALTGGAGGAMDALLHRQAMEQQQQQGGSGMGGDGQGGQGNASALQQFSLFQQLQQQQVGAVPNMNDESNHSNHETEEPSSRRVKMENSGNGNPKGPGIPWTITQHTHLLERGDPDGSRLRAYYKCRLTNSTACRPHPPTKSTAPVLTYPV
jgi:hypothetical protein